jgi:hypothetical protein
VSNYGTPSVSLDELEPDLEPEELITSNTNGILLNGIK